MRAAPTFAGIALLAVGLLMINFGAYSYVVDVPKIETHLLFDKVKLSPIGDFAVKDVYLQQNWIVNLDGKVQVPDSNKSGQIDLYVMNDKTYQSWKNGQKNISYVLQRQKVDIFNETFISLENGTFYILFDNSLDPTYKKEVTISARYTSESMVPEARQERILTQIGYPIAVLGVISLIYGVVRKPVVRWE
jgi:hypothetical protein